MRTICIAIIVIGSLAVIFGAAGDVDYGQQRRLKVVEQYDYNAREYQVNPKTASRWIDYLYFYDAAGKVAERWDFFGNYYRRHVFSRDRKGRTSADLMYESAHLGENDRFKIERSNSGVKVLPAVGNALIEITLTEYNGRDKEIEERTTDGDGILKRKITREFNKYDQLTFFREEDGKGTLVGQELRILCSADGPRCESVSRAEDGTMIKNISVSDEKHREVLGETFRYPSTASKTDKPLLTGRSVFSYSGDLTNFDWFLFRDDGTPTQRLMIVQQNDRETSRKAFTPVTKDDGSLSWLPESEELRECTFNKDGECVKEIWKERRSGETEFKFTLVHERVVSWY